MRVLPILTALAVALPGAAAAQSGNVEARVGRLESEMRAVQRKVFPGGAGQLLQPEVTAPETPVATPGVPVSSPVVDLAARVSSLEQQLASITGQVEQNGFQLRQLREQFESYRKATDARLAADQPAPIEPAAPPQGGPAEPADKPAAPAPATAAVTRPSTGDAAEDGYLYGYRLWQAKRYGEAQAQLKKVVADHPRHRRASFAQNLLGRAYLDDGKPSLASIAFYDNYKKYPNGDRAPDSLLYLGQALTRLDKPADACKVYDELSDVYAGKISAGMRADITKGRATAKCKAG